ncbi:alpha/beta fold hydrolase [Nonomuraea africana]|uniref:Pimeloyl-ACP methyl ester carboxylesterase n=1 Tax=Nonomuraea africana TaxID=46171 RepID=A0ABR9KI40_9ACTN|nr:alpha/beta hydrolase [Nonomuraea africana]MBE1561678.1 pimeloyl-ACP methyl ester carboxylesterase [Nonomuraea africana]
MKLEDLDGLRIATFGTGPRRIVAVHGITASLMAWAAVARRLPPGWSLVAMDLRGRGHSRDRPGPYGLARHAEDVLRVAEHVGAGPEAVLAGHSMGAYVAVLAGARRRFAKVVLVDGGLPFPPPVPDADVDAEIEATLGPAIARLSRTFATADDYVGFFRAHPAFAGNWTPEAEEYVRYDLFGPAGARALGPWARPSARTAGGCGSTASGSGPPWLRSRRPSTCCGPLAGCSTRTSACCPTSWRRRGPRRSRCCATRWWPTATTTRSCSTTGARRWWRAASAHEAARWPAR